MRQKAIYALLIVLVTVLSGCFEFEQTMYLKTDGSGRAEFKYALPLDMLQGAGFDLGGAALPLTPEQLENRFGARPGVTLLGGSFREQDNLKIVNVMLEFDNPTRLDESGMKYQWFVEGEERVMRVIIDRKPQNIKLSQVHRMLVDGMDDNGARITLHMPRRISYTNADKSDGNTARWFLPAGWLLNPNAGPKTLEARFKITTLERIKSWFEDIF